MSAQILVVDSDPSHARRLAEAIETEGYEVAVADGAAAAAALAGGSLRVLLLDPTSRDAAGLRSARRESVAHFEMSDLFVGPSNRDIAISAFGCADAFEKPVRMSELAPWLSRVVGVPARRDAPASVPRLLPLQPQDGERQHAVTAPAPLPAAAAATRPALGPGGSQLPPGVVVPEALDTRSLVAAGRIEDASPAHVLAHAGRIRWTGLARFSGPDGTRDAFLADGALVAVRSSAPSDRLSAVLLVDGLLRADQVDAVARNLGPAAVDDPATYVDAGLVEAEDVPAVQLALALRRLQPVLSWSSGTYELAPGSAVDFLPRPLPILEVLWRCIPHEIPAAWLHAALRPGLERPMVWIGPPPGRDTLSLTQWQRGVLAGIDGETPTHALIEGARERDAAVALLYVLVLCGVTAFSR